MNGTTTRHQRWRLPTLSVLCWLECQVNALSAVTRRRVVAPRRHATIIILMVGISWIERDLDPFIRRMRIGNKTDTIRSETF